MPECVKVVDGERIDDPERIILPELAVHLIEGVLLIGKFAEAVLVFLFQALNGLEVSLQIRKSSGVVLYRIEFCL